LAGRQTVFRANKHFLEKRCQQCPYHRPYPRDLCEERGAQCRDTGEQEEGAAQHRNTGEFDAQMPSDLREREEGGQEWSGWRWWGV